MHYKESADSRSNIFAGVDPIPEEPDSEMNDSDKSIVRVESAGGKKQDNIKLKNASISFRENFDSSKV